MLVKHCEVINIRARFHCSQTDQNRLIFHTYMFLVILNVTQNGANCVHKLTEVGIIKCVHAVNN